ncbi:substrate-binding periplasmic protein [Dongshaea marina]|uniref:substrate-binding periplasmic protein n=1 Tax=Dongshaea marina TaxID=2047966 RepID=UPI000D3EDC59|nr:transporter substrate-binding domain-containing protein [Dongshaea marina]
MQTSLKKRISLSLLLGATLCLLLSSLPARATEKLLRFSIPPRGNPPYLIVHKEGLPTGIIWDILSRVAKQQGYRLVPVKTPRKRVDQSMRFGQLDATARAMEWTPDPEQFIFSEPMFKARDVIFSPIQRPLQFSSPKDLIGKKLRAQLGYHYPKLAPYFNTHQILRMDDMDSYQQLRKLLLAPYRFDGAIVNEWVGRWLIRRHQWQGYFAISKQDVGDVDYRLMFNKKWLSFVDAFNRELTKMKKNGQLQEIVQSYQ